MKHLSAFRRPNIEEIGIRSNTTILSNIVANRNALFNSVVARILGDGDKRPNEVVEIEGDPMLVAIKL